MRGGAAHERDAPCESEPFGASIIAAGAFLGGERVHGVVLGWRWLTFKAADALCKPCLAGSLMSRMGLAIEILRREPSCFGSRFLGLRGHGAP